MGIKASKIIDKLKQMKGRRNVNPIKRVTESEDIPGQLNLSQQYELAAQKRAEEAAKAEEVKERQRIEAAEDREYDRGFIRSFPKRFGKGYTVRTPRSK